jgi:tetratricopeptide (TPR) repeat protein
MEVRTLAERAVNSILHYSAGRAAFLEGDYRHALRLAGHAAVDAPQNPKVHELISLSLFALGNYSAAASEAHAAMTLGPIAEWKDIFGYYNNADKYTAQFRALEKASTDDTKSAAEHFLLAYHYLITGARDSAKRELADAVKLTPNGKLASYYLKQIESNSPLTPPQMATEPNGEPRCGFYGCLAARFLTLEVS